MQEFSFRQDSDFAAVGNLGEGLLDVQHRKMKDSATAVGPEIVNLE